MTLSVAMVLVSPGVGFYPVLAQTFERPVEPAPITVNVSAAPVSVPGSLAQPIAPQGAELNTSVTAPNLNNAALSLSQSADNISPIRQQPKVIPPSPNATYPLIESPLGNTPDRGNGINQKTHDGLVFIREMSGILRQKISSPGSLFDGSSLGTPHRPDEPASLSMTGDAAIPNEQFPPFVMESVVRKPILPLPGGSSGGITPPSPNSLNDNGDDEEESSAWIKSAWMTLAFYGAKFTPAGYTQSLTNVLVKELRNSNPEVRAKALDMLEKLGHEKFLEPVLNAPEPDYEALISLSGLGSGQSQDSSPTSSSSSSDNIPPATPNGSQGNSHDSIQTKMVEFLTTIKNILEAQHAPTELNKSEKTPNQWDLEKNFQTIKEKIYSAGITTIKQFHQILKEFINSTWDYHVHISFSSTESASLPFNIKSAIKDGHLHFYIAEIDRSKLTEQSFPFSEGDEITGFSLDASNNTFTPIEEAINTLKRLDGKNVEGTDQKLATLNLTLRRGAAGMDVPSVPVVIKGIRAADKKEFTFQLAWDYTPEVLENNSSAAAGKIDIKNISKLQDILGSHKNSAISALLFKMVMPLYETWGDTPGSDFESVETIGSRKSFLTTHLADEKNIVWKANDDSPFPAYIYTLAEPNGKTKRVGYVRIPTYEPEDEDAAIQAFEGLVQKFEKETDFLLVDQVNNPGGNVFYMETLLSMLANNHAFKTPKHHMAITSTEVKAAAAMAQLKRFIKTDEMAKTFLTPIFGGYFASLQFLQFLDKWARFIVTEWHRLGGPDNGHVITAPTHLYGIDQINPSSRAQYTKKIGWIINEGDFSAADFAAAILQDNNRATMIYVGSAQDPRTAGAGGLVKMIGDIPNEFGVESLSVTESQGKRLDGSLVEGRGVTATPGFVHQLTENDVQHQYQDARKALGDFILRLLAQP